MFHATAWVFPFSCTFAGATQVFPGPYLDAESLLLLLDNEKVTMTAGVPTVMRSVLNLLNTDPYKFKLCLRTIVVGVQRYPAH
jgi:fatty-acyl-CoA synthase